MGLKKFHAVLISSNDYWVYDPDSYDTKTKLYSDFTVVKGDSKKEDSDMKQCSYFFELNNEDNHGFKPIAIKYDDAEGFLIVEGEQKPMGKLKKRVFQIGESARRYKNMRGPRHSVDTIVVSRDSKKQEIKDYLKQQQDDSKSAETFQADTLNQINPIFVEGAEDVMGAEYIEFSKSDFDEIEDSLEKDIKNLKQTHRMMLDFKDAESNDRMSELENKAKKLYLDEIDEVHIKEVCDEYDLDYHDKKDYAKACSKYLDQIDYIHILDMLDSDDLKELKQLYKDNDISYYKQMGAESEIFCADCGGRRKYDAESSNGQSFDAEHSCGCGDEMALEAEEWDFGNDREALRNSDENSDFNNAWRWIFKTKRRGWPSWGQKFYDKYKWTLDDSTWNPYAKGGDFEDEEEPKGFRDAEDDEIAYKIVEQLVDAGDNDLLIEVAKYLGIGYEYEDRYNDMDILFDEVEKTIKNAPKKYLYQLDKALMEDMNAEGVEAETFEAQSDDLFVLTFSDPMRYGKMVQLPFTSRNQAERYVDMHIRPYNKKRPHQNIVYSIKQDEQDEQDVVDFVQEISPFPMGKLFASFIVVGVSAIAGAKLLNR
jgi:hypothetical protein